MNNSIINGGPASPQQPSATGPSDVNITFGGSNATANSYLGQQCPGAPKKPNFRTQRGANSTTQRGAETTTQWGEKMPKGIATILFP
jgi:hypothetical protein